MGRVRKRLLPRILVWLSTDRPRTVCVCGAQSTRCVSSRQGVQYGHGRVNTAARWCLKGFLNHTSAVAGALPSRSARSAASALCQSPEEIACSSIVERVLNLIPASGLQPGMMVLQTASEFKPSTEIAHARGV